MFFTNNMLLLRYFLPVVDCKSPRHCAFGAGSAKLDLDKLGNVNNTMAHHAGPGSTQGRIRVQGLRPDGHQLVSGRRKGGWQGDGESIEARLPQGDTALRRGCRSCVAGPACPLQAGEESVEVVQEIAAIKSPGVRWRS